MRRRSLSTGELARYCQVTPATVVNWIRAGKLDVYTTPGGQYRMELTKFLDFLNGCGFPIPDELRSDRTRRVLIIDDDDELRALLIEVVVALGDAFVVNEASNGYDGLVEVGGFKPDLVILDLKMPKMDGAEMFRRLRANPTTKGIRVLVVSGLSPTDEMVRKVRRSGADGYLSKPVDINQFGALVEKLA